LVGIDISFQARNTNQTAVTKFQRNCTTHAYTVPDVSLSFIVIEHFQEIYQKRRNIVTKKCFWKKQLLAKYPHSGTGYEVFMRVGGVMAPLGF